jgi:hypothetical protein
MGVLSKVAILFYESSGRRRAYGSSLPLKTLIHQGASSPCNAAESDRTSIFSVSGFDLVVLGVSLYLNSNPIFSPFRGGMGRPEPSLAVVSVAENFLNAEAFP